MIGDARALHDALPDTPRDVVSWNKLCEDVCHAARHGQAIAYVCTDAAHSCHEAVHGLVAVVPYPGPQAQWQTLTQLAPCLRGRGLTAPIKSAQWRWMRELSCGDSSAELVAAVDTSNIRSRRSLAKLYPQARRMITWQPWTQHGGRFVELWMIDGPPL